MTLTVRQMRDDNLKRLDAYMVGTYQTAPGMLSYYASAYLVRGKSFRTFCIASRKEPSECWDAWMRACRIERKWNSHRNDQEG